jgi:hypothetical protein
VGTGPDRLSAATAPLLALELRANPTLVTYRVSKSVVSGISPEGAPTLLRFLTSSTTSQLWVLSGPGLSLHRALELPSPVALLPFGPSNTLPEDCVVVVSV